MLLSDNVKSKVESFLSGSKVKVVDFSDEHKGHHAPGAHIAITVCWDGFIGMSLVDQHKIVYKIFSDELKNSVIHALRIRTRLLGDYDG